MMAANPNHQMLNPSTYPGGVSPIPPAASERMTDCTMMSAWIMQIGTVRYRVISLSFFRPPSPSLRSRSSDGTTPLAKSWMMIDAEM